MVSLQEYKTKKKYKKLVEDIDNILKVFLLTKKSLAFFQSYRPVVDALFAINNSQQILELHKKKYESELEKITKANS